MREMYESISIIFQILTNITTLTGQGNQLLGNNSNSNNINFFSFFDFMYNQKSINLNRHTKYNSMESLINHFKHYSEGLKITQGFVYKAVEAPKGEFGVSLIADGTSYPYRCKIRTPAYHHMQVTPRLVQGHFFADLVTVLGSQDIVFGDVDR
jgi:NADH:ubiquinone oxidoreductase subunit D